MPEPPPPFVEFLFAHASALRVGFALGLVVVVWWLWSSLVLKLMKNARDRW